MASAERAKTLVQRLLAFARRQPLQARAIDVASLIAEMGDLIRTSVGPQIKLTFDLGSNLPLAKVDPQQLEMAILNLSVNARDAMPEGGMLTISARSEMIDRDPGDVMPRPVWLLDAPLPLASGLVLEQGPERIESGWWDGRGVARDYYVARQIRGARQSHGAKLWVFQERQSKRWYLHGMFA